MSMSEARAKQLADAWERGWNGEDVDTIMAPYADDVRFNSPFVERVTGDPALPWIVGADALRAYVVNALERTPGIRYTHHASYVSTETLVLLYTVHFPDGRADQPGADLMRVDAEGKVVEWRSHYDPSFRPG